MPKPVFYRVQIVADANPFTYQMTSEPFYNPADAVRAARNLSLLADGREATILNERGVWVATFGWTGEGDDAVPAITTTGAELPDARLVAALDAARG
jgi:hypothetical protein